MFSATYLRQKLTKISSTVFASALLITMAAGASTAATSVSFLTPPDGSSEPAGTSVTPTGIASSVGGTAGTGLDLVLVLDSSGSMSGSRRTAQRAAAIALVNALPAGSTSVSIVEFDSNSSVVRTLTPLTPASNIALLEAAINSVDASGGTNIGSGIDSATSILTGSGHTSGRSQQMVVLSDGSSSGDPGAAAAAAVAVGVDAVHSVGLPAHNVATMKDIATSGGGVYTDGSDLSTLTGLFDGTGGNLVGLDYVDIWLPDGTYLHDVATDGLGNFTVPQGYNIALGPNTWSVTAFGEDGTQASSTVTVNGYAPSVVPLPAAGFLLIAALGGLGFAGRRRRT